jgi:predicted PolB exonuclease-like 3'-5' exonuclease
MNIFVFDIETIPDCASGRRIRQLGDLSDTETASALQALQKEKTGSDFLPHYLQKVITISVVFRQKDNLRVWSLGDETADEGDILTRFFKGVEKYTPTLVSWNGSGFDLPVLHYRALVNNIEAPRYWEVGQMDPQFRWNNYLSRYHYRHMDLMDIMAGYSPRANAPLDDLAVMLGFPGKMGVSGSQVWDLYQDNQIKKIRDYCETDVLNTYLVYLRFEKMRGILSAEQYEHECQFLKDYLSQENKAHFTEFLTAWNRNSTT